MRRLLGTARQTEPRRFDRGTDRGRAGAAQPRARLAYGVANEKLRTIGSASPSSVSMSDPSKASMSTTTVPPPGDVEQREAEALAAGDNPAEATVLPDEQRHRRQAIRERAGRGPPGRDGEVELDPAQATDGREPRAADDQAVEAADPRGELARQGSDAGLGGRRAGQVLRGGERVAEEVDSDQVGGDRLETEVVAGVGWDPPPGGQRERDRRLEGPGRIGAGRQGRREGRGLALARCTRAGPSAAGEQHSDDDPPSTPDPRGPPPRYSGSTTGRAGPHEGEAVPRTGESTRFATCQPWGPPRAPRRHLHGGLAAVSTRSAPRGPWRRMLLAATGRNRAGHAHPNPSAA